MKNYIIWILTIFLGSSLISEAVYADRNLPPLEAVSSVDLKRYLGTWYEIARFPNSFQKKCVGNVTATYSLRNDGDISVVNRCKKMDGSFSESSGKAWITDKNTNAKLRVRFFWPFSGDYWIIILDQDYGYAVVSEPSRKYLWILSRTPGMKRELYNEIVENLKAKSFDISYLTSTPQE